MYAWLLLPSLFLPTRFSKSNSSSVVSCDIRRNLSCRLQLVVPTLFHGQTFYQSHQIVAHLTSTLRTTPIEHQPATEVGAIHTYRISCSLAARHCNTDSGRKHHHAPAHRRNPLLKLAPLLCLRYAHTCRKTCRPIRRRPTMAGPQPCHLQFLQQLHQQFNRAIFSRRHQYRHRDDHMVRIHGSAGFQLRH